MDEAILGFWLEFKQPRRWCQQCVGGRDREVSSALGKFEVKGISVPWIDSGRDYFLSDDFGEGRTPYPSLNRRWALPPASLATSSAGQTGAGQAGHWVLWSFIGIG